jgi:hypothetical protein
LLQIGRSVVEIISEFGFVLPKRWGSSQFFEKQLGIAILVWAQVVIETPAQVLPLRTKRKDGGRSSA